MTGRSKTPPKGEVRPSGTKRPKAKERRSARKAAQPEAAEPSMAEKLAPLPEAEPEVRAMLDRAIGSALIGPETVWTGFDAPENNSGSTQKVVDTAAASGVSSVHEMTKDGNDNPTTAAAQPGTDGETKMTLTKKGLSKNGRNVFYAGALVALRIPLTAFPDKNPPETIEVADGVFAPAKQPKAKMTAEERKAARAAQPKLTLAQRIERREQALARDREKLAKQAAGGDQPQL